MLAAFDKANAARETGMLSEELMRAAQVAVEQCLGVKAGETVLGAFA